tara:strand:- start:241 stop:408 length:168 start_codon:yes stop_codon:yes gene_type:complete
LKYSFGRTCSDTHPYNLAYLVQIVHAHGDLRLALRTAQGRQQQGGKDGNDDDHHQ